MKPCTLATLEPAARRCVHTRLCGTSSVIVAQSDGYVASADSSRPVWYSPETVTTRLRLSRTSGSVCIKWQPLTCVLLRHDKAPQTYSAASIEDEIYAFFPA